MSVEIQKKSVPPPNSMGVLQYAPTGDRGNIEIVFQDSIIKNTSELWYPLLCSGYLERKLLSTFAAPAGGGGEKLWGVGL
jgi:hypothetical protein